MFSINLGSEKEDTWKLYVIAYCAPSVQLKASGRWQLNVWVDYPVHWKSQRKYCLIAVLVITGALLLPSLSVF